MNEHTVISRFRAQRGLTMVELMVALLLGLLLTGGAIQVFMANRATTVFNDGLSRLQENGRFALDAISYNVRMAGYLGCLSQVPVYNSIDPSPSLAFDFEQGVMGFEAVGTAGTGPGDTFVPGAVDPSNSADADDWDPPLDAAVLGNAIPGSDVLVVRNVSPQSYSLASPFNNADQVFANAATTDFQAGDIAVVSDCQKASVFQITGVTAGGAGVINIDHAGMGTPGNAVTSWSLSDQSYGETAHIMRGETWVYYVGERGGDGPPALFQMRLRTTGATTSQLVDEELVDGVDTMQILYGVDDGLDGNLDAYRTADVVDAANEWDEVVTVRVSLLLRAPEEYGTELDTRVYDVNETLFNPVDDRRFRQVFTSTVAIRNRLP